jgi:predicted transcriptional regulator
MMTPHELRSKRVAAEIAATVLATKAKVNRSRLSNIECGHVQPNENELQRLNRALERLIKARTAIRKTAVAAGWPTGVLR